MGCSSVYGKSLEPTEGSYSLGPILWVFVFRAPEYPAAGSKCIHLYLCLSAPGTFFLLVSPFFHPPVTPQGSESVQSFASSIVRADRQGLRPPLFHSDCKIFSTLQHKPLLKIDPFPPLLPFLKSYFYIDFIPAASFQVNPSTFPLLTQFSLKENRSSSVLKKSY